MMASKNVNSKDMDWDENGFALLIRAAKRGDAYEVRNLLSLGATVDLADNDGNTPLMWAASSGFIRVIEELLSSGAKVNQVNKNGDTPLIRAAMSNQASASVKLLLSKGAAIDLANKVGYTPLIGASMKNYFGAVEHLLQLGATVDLADKDGNTPLIWAAMEGSTTSLQYLLSSGATVDLANKDGKTALMRAKESKWSNRLIVSLLEGASERRVPIVAPPVLSSKEIEKPIYQISNNKAVTSSTPPGYPLHQTSTYPDVTFYGEPQEKKFTSSGGHASYDNGIEVSVPSNAVPPGSTVSIKVQPSLAPKDVFIMPEGIQSASPYLISPDSPTSLNRAMTITMEHHVRVTTRKEADNLVFLQADSSPKRSASGCVYQYQEVKEGRPEFIPGDCRGRLTVKRFFRKFLKVGTKIRNWLGSHDRIAGTSQVPKSSSPVPNLYTARVYRSPPQATSDRLAIICVSLFGQLYTKFLDILDNVIIPRDYPEVSSRVADRTTLGSLQFNELCALLHINSLPGWSVESDKEMISKSEADQPEMENFRLEDLHDYPPRIACRFHPKKNVSGRATCTILLAGLVPEVKVHIPLKAPEFKVAIVDTTKLRVVADQLRGTALLVNHAQLGSTVYSIVSLMEKLADALRLSSLSDLATHTDSIKAEIMIVLKVTRRVAEECTRQTISETIGANLSKVEALSHQLCQVAKVKLKHCRDQSEETAALMDLIESGTNLLRTIVHLLKDVQTLSEMSSTKGLTVEGLKRNIRVSDAQLDTKITEHDIHNLAGYFDEVETYIYKLNLTPAQQTDIRDLAHQCNTKAAMAKALILWRQPNPFASTFRALLEILLELQRGDVAVNVCSYVLENI